MTLIVGKEGGILPTFCHVITPTLWFVLRPFEKMQNESQYDHDYPPSLPPKCYFVAAPYPPGQ